MTKEQTLNIQQAMDLAIHHHHAGDLPKAESIYQQTFKANPNQLETLHLLGVISYQFGKNNITVDLLTKAIYPKADFNEAYNNLGNIFDELGNILY